jgi:hypothetical protein
VSTRRLASLFVSVVLIGSLGLMTGVPARAQSEGEDVPRTDVPDPGVPPEVPDPGPAPEEPPLRVPDRPDEIAGSDDQPSGPGAPADDEADPGMSSDGGTNESEGGFEFTSLSSGSRSGDAPQQQSESEATDRLRALSGSPAREGAELPGNLPAELGGGMIVRPGELLAMGPTPEGTRDAALNGSRAVAPAIPQNPGPGLLPAVVPAAGIPTATGIPQVVNHVTGRPLDPLRNHPNFGTPSAPPPASPYRNGYQPFNVAGSDNPLAIIGTSTAVGAGAGFGAGLLPAPLAPVTAPVGAAIGAVGGVIAGTGMVARNLFNRWFGW